MAVKDLKNLETKLERGISKICSKKMSLLLGLYELISAKEAVINGGAEIKGLIALFHQVFVMHHPPSLPSSSNS
ncbi:hypothetical protein HN873_015858 [Arachis hypogaea]